MNKVTSVRLLNALSASDRELGNKNDTVAPWKACTAWRGWSIDLSQKEIVCQS